MNYTTLYAKDTHRVFVTRNRRFFKSTPRACPHACARCREDSSETTVSRGLSPLLRIVSVGTKIAPVYSRLAIAISR